MATAEFSLIERFFAAHARGSRHAGVEVGIGDDAAVLRVPDDQRLVVAVDSLVEGVHFPAAAPAASVGHKALAVNLSDLAAMGAEPRWATLALTVPTVDTDWLEDFARGFFALADHHGVELVGGDTTRGPLTISVQVMGLVPPGEALLRCGARPGDAIFVSGTLGDAGLGLRVLQGKAACEDDAFRTRLEARLHRPEPRLALGRELRGLTTAAIDVSDGLLADLGHLLDATAVGATLWVDRLPRSDALRGVLGGPEAADWFELPLAAGDDYELCFTVAPAQSETVLACAAALDVPVTQVGTIETEPGVRARHDDGRTYTVQARGYEHFR